VWAAVSAATVEATLVTADIDIAGVEQRRQALLAPRRARSSAVPWPGRPTLDMDIKPTPDMDIKSWLRLRIRSTGGDLPGCRIGSILRKPLSILQSCHWHLSGI
jgi:hypothetical protein